MEIKHNKKNHNNKKNQEQRKKRVLQDILSPTDTGGAHEKMSQRK